MQRRGNQIQHFFKSLLKFQANLFAAYYANLIAKWTSRAAAATSGRKLWKLLLFLVGLWVRAKEVHFPFEVKTESSKVLTEVLARNVWQLLLSPCSWEDKAAAVKVIVYRKVFVKFFPLKPWFLLLSNLLQQSSPSFRNKNEKARQSSVAGLVALSSRIQNLFQISGLPENHPKYLFHWKKIPPSPTINLLC